jgi:hypothetical protein
VGWEWVWRPFKAPDSDEVRSDGEPEAGKPKARDDDPSFQILERWPTSRHG